MVMVGGHETFGTLGSHPDWGPTPVGEVLPVETLVGRIGGGRVTILEGDNAFINSIPWRPELSFLQLYYCNIVLPKAGSETLAIDLIRAGDNQGWENPFFSTWEHGRGRTFAFAGDWQFGWGAAFIRWEYTPDFVINLMLYLAGRRLPEDLDLVHTLRSRLATLSYRRSIMESLIAFRPLQGVAGAMLPPSSLAVIIATFPRRNAVRRSGSGRRGERSPGPSDG